MFIIVGILVLTAYAKMPDEGMYPLSEIAKLDLKKAGLKITTADVYSPGKTSLIDALVRVGGCTGSFISKDGLIITNHHCAFDYVRQASTVENNYLENGFYAGNREKEIPAQGLTCMITESYTDVSKQILAAADSAKLPQERIPLIQKKIKELVREEEAKDAGLKVEVSEMFTGKTYVLFRYRILKDVRLVFIPPRSIGDFGGDADNWVWPRHTGDFSFLRAYIGKDGKPAEYAIDNVPYSPKKILKVNPNGVDENDFVFVLGYPGRTFRHQPSRYLEFQEMFQLPYISGLYKSFIDIYQEAGAANPALALKFSSRVKSLANTQKNYDGKILGMKRLGLTAQKKAEDAQLQEYILQDVKRAAAYKDVIVDIGKVYDEQFMLGRANFAIGQLRSRIVPTALASQLLEYRAELRKDEKERKTAYSTKNLPSTLKNISENLSEVELDVDITILTRLLSEAAKLTEFKNFAPLKPFAGSDEDCRQAISNLLKGSIVYDSAAYMQTLTSVTDVEVKDKLVTFLRAVSDEYKRYEKQYDELNGKLNTLLPKYIEAKSEWKKSGFIPDANSTLRLTYGYIRGYSPADATYYRPITTLRGAIEKSSAGGVYSLNAKVRELYEKKDFGRYRNKKLNDVPVAILYNMDTTGGNSGSPVMDAEGNIIGVNFDRAFEATINDFAWSESYSRSIAVDIRYVLWVVEKVGNAPALIQEMGL